MLYTLLLSTSPKTVILRLFVHYQKTLIKLASQPKEYQYIGSTPTNRSTFVVEYKKIYI